VAATTEADLLADYSNYGPCVDYLAPGSGILTASHTDNGGSLHTSGTSLAAAHVAGAAALLLASEQAENPDRVDIFLYLRSYYEKQIDLQAKHTNDYGETKNRLIYVREAAIAPTVEEKAKTCYSCQYSRSGCPCMKEWSYPYNGASHKVTDYCANPYGDDQGPYCMTQVMCTIRVKGQPPRRSRTDYCDVVPGRRLSGGWLLNPHVYEPEEYHGPPERAEDTCVSAAPSPSGGGPSPQPPAQAQPNPTPSWARPTPAPEARRRAPANGGGNTPDPKAVMAKVQADTTQLKKDMDCLEKRLHNLPC